MPEESSVEAQQMSTFNFTLFFVSSLKNNNHRSDADEKAGGKKGVKPAKTSSGKKDPKPSKGEGGEGDKKGKCILL